MNVRTLRPVRARIVAAVIALVLGACGGGDDGASTSATSSTEASTTITTYGGTPGAAQAIACTQSAKTLQQAADFYAASHGGPAASIDALAADGLIQAAPPTDNGYVVSYDATTGKVTAAGACAYP